jgi:hypothetical protein
VDENMIDILAILLSYFTVTFLLYAIRWQLSSPSLAIVSALVVAKMTGQPLKWPTKAEWIGAIAANAVGSLLFYPVDKFLIF